MPLLFFRITDFKMQVLTENNGLQIPHNFRADSDVESDIPIFFWWVEQRNSLGFSTQHHYVIKYILLWISIWKPMCHRCHYMEQNKNMICKWSLFKTWSANSVWTHSKWPLFNIVVNLQHFHLFKPLDINFAWAWIISRWKLCFGSGYPYKHALLEI